MKLNRRHLTLGMAAAAAAPRLALGQTPTNAGAASAAAAPLSIDDLFKLPAYGNVTLSPNGQFMAATIPLFDRQNLAVLDVEKREAKVLSGMKHADVRSIFWASDDRIIYTTGDRQGKDFAGDGGIFAVNKDGSGARTLVEPFLAPDKIRFVWRETTLIGRVPGNPDELVVSANDRQVRSQDIYRLNVQNGRKTLVSVDTPGHVLQWVLDKDLQPRAALCHDIDQRRWWFAYRAAGASAGAWKTLAEWDERLENVVIPRAFDPLEPKSMYVCSNVGRNTLAFFKFDLDSGKLGELVAGTDRYDMGSFYLIGSPLGEGGRLLFGGTEDQPGKLIGLRLNADRETTIWFDDEARRLQAAIDQALPGRVNRFDPNRSRSLVFSYSSTEPGAWFLFDKTRRSMEDTGIRSRPWLDSAQMSPTRYVTYTARDGMKIGAYLTLPRQARTGTPVPLVLLPHGGPWAKDNWSFDAEAQFLASRGFAVLQPNFRGSTGYGARHLTASYKQWGGTMIDDMIDGVEWAIKEGHADKARIGAYGASYGGYATLALLVKRPDLFRWGVNYVGVTDMAVHQDTQPAQLYGNFAGLAKIINGDQKADAAMFQATSPARHVDKIVAPVFHAYGGQDRNVDYANGREIKSAFDKAGKPYEWMFVADEAHGYRQPPNVKAFYTRFEAFIRQHTPAMP